MAWKSLLGPTGKTPYWAHWQNPRIVLVLTRTATHRCVSKASGGRGRVAWGAWRGRGGAVASQRSGGRDRGAWVVARGAGGVVLIRSSGM
jgi:hypothetical protein